MIKFKKFLNKKTLIILTFGISSGLPLGLILGTLQAWMSNEGVSLTTIGFFGFVQLPYTLKFVWAPLMDRFSISKIGRRKSWMFLTQGFLILAILGLALTSPKNNLWMVAFLALLVSFFSASQDIVVDAWRRESLTDKELGFGSSVHVAGYLFSFRMISGAFALILADHMSWNMVYALMSLVIVLGLVATYLCEEPVVSGVLPTTFKESVIDPFLDYFSKPGAIVILVFILLYKLGDNMAFNLSTPFYLALGFTKTEIGTISKLVGWACLALGGLVGGALMLRMRLYTALLLFGALQGVATFGFAILSMIGKNNSALAAVIATENFIIGMATTAFVAFMASLTNKKFTATQYALLTSFMGVPRSLFMAPTGYMAEHMGWFNYFTLCSLVAIPGLLMIFWMKKFEGESV